MITHTDYPFHGEYQLANPHQLHRGVITHLGRVGNSNDWCLHVSSYDIDMKNYIVASLTILGNETVPIFRSNCYLSFLNHKDKSKSKVFTEKLDSSRDLPISGPLVLESDMLDENSGWLKDGELTVEYGIHVEAFKETIWKFNLYHPMFRCEQANNTFAFGHNEAERNVLYSHKQLLMHHFPSVLTMDKKYVDAQDYFKFDSLEKCLQILNGARIRLELSDLLNVLKMAHYFSLYNVVRYCEMELIQRKDEIKFIRNRIQFATHCKLSRYLASVLREKESPEAVKEDFRQVNIDRMTGEMMKQCVMYLLRFY